MHVIFWIATTIIVVNAVLIMKFGRYSQSLQDYRYGSDLHVLIGTLLVLFGVGFYLEGYLVVPTIFMLFGALLCVEPLKKLHERSLEW